MKYLKKYLISAALVLCIAASSYAIFHHQDIQDWWILRNYTVPERIDILADKLTLTDLGRKLLYVHKPELLDKPTFQQKCEFGEKTIVLGCYVDLTGIYIYDVQDERLQGVHEVTTAHEMLHAAYSRLSTGEKRHINDLLQRAFAVNTNDRIKSAIESYRLKDPSVVSNELHSILGTEEKILPPELEEYYKKYFIDRSKVVDYSLQYEDEFSSRTNQIKRLETELDELRPKIFNAQNDISFQRSLLNIEKNRLDSLLQANRIDEYNAAVVGFNQRVVTYNNSISRLQILIDNFNEKVAEHNSIAAEQKELIDAIDTRATTETLR